MPDADVVLKLDQNQLYYLPGDVLSGEFVLDLDGDQQAKRVEFAILWHTVGKGDENEGFHDHRVWTRETGGPLGPQSTYQFTSALPIDPLTYDGILLKIRWLVRVKVQLGLFSKRQAEAPFRLGNCTGFAEPI